ncbi:MAG: hypothetical protein JW786_15115 [Desulfobacterales bacterium]|nr:hypothetical protein [Desulfobacterales bacterium]
MAKKKGKATSFDAMVKFFMQNYNIPTKKDIDRLIKRLDNLEKYIKTAVTAGRYRRVARSQMVKDRSSNGETAMSASDTVLEILGRFKDGAGFAEIQAETGFGEKKLRNIIFRLNKIGKITRKNRGIYIVS